MMVVSSGIAMMHARMRVTARNLNDLGADPRSHPAGNEKAGDQRSRLANQRNRQPRGNHRFGAETLERGARMHRQHNADGEARQCDERHRSPTDFEDVAGDFLELIRRHERFVDRS
jgi:hypothetical protein